jgi:hypothetical protein
MQPISERPSVDVAALYTPGLIIPKTKRIHGKPLPTSFEFLPDAASVSDLVSPWKNEILAIAGAAGLTFDAVAARVASLMGSLTPEETWNREAEQQLRRRMDNADIKYPYRRLRFAQTRRAVFVVVAELADAGRLSKAALSSFELMFRTYDPELVTFRPSARPREIVAVTRAQYDEFKQAWVADVRQFDTATLCRQVAHLFVIAEKSKLKPSGTGTATETRISVVCSTSLGLPDPDIEQNRFFPSLMRETVSTYYDSSSDVAGLPVLEHNGWGYDTPGDGWLALDAALARSFGWQPCPDRLLTWIHNGQIMSQTVWWADGLFEQSMPYYRKSEVGEGWLVLASPEAMEAVKSHIGEMQRIVSVKREIIESDFQPFCETIYRRVSTE